MTIGVAVTLVSVWALSRWSGVGADLAVLLASGYAVCGASAIAAVSGVRGADEEDVAFAVAVVTVFGSLSVVVLPLVAGWLGFGAEPPGAWIGASVHDVGQVVAAASTAGPHALAVAVVVKLCRVAMLAPLVAASQPSPGAGITCPAGTAAGCGCGAPS